MHILLRRIRDELSKAEIHHQALSEARAVIRPRHRHDGNSHEYRVARRSAAGIWKGIQCDIHIRIFVEIFERESPRLQAIPRNPHTLHAAHQVLAILRIVKQFSFQQKARILRSFQNPRPKSQRLIGRFAEIIETAESDIAIPYTWRLACWKRHIPDFFIAEMRVRQNQQFFRERFLCLLVVKIDVAQEIIDSRQPRRRPIADSANLYRRGLIRENVQSVSRRMAAQFHENVDLIFVDPARRLLRRKAAKIPPAVHALFQLLAERIFPSRHISVYGKRGRAFAPKHRRHKSKYHMIAKIRRNISDAQLLARTPPTMTKPPDVGVKRVIFRRRRTEFFRRASRQIMQIEQIIPVLTRGQFRRNFRRLQIVLHRFFALPEHAAYPPQDIANAFPDLRSHIFFQKRFHRFDQGSSRAFHILESCRNVFCVRLIRRNLFQLFQRLFRAFLIACLDRIRRQHFQRSFAVKRHKRLDRLTCPLQCPVFHRGIRRRPKLRRKFCLLLVHRPLALLSRRKTSPTA